MVGIVPDKFQRNFLYILRGKRSIFSLRKKEKKKELKNERKKEVTEVKECIGKGGKEERKKKKKEKRKNERKKARRK